MSELKSKVKIVKSWRAKIGKLLFTLTANISIFRKNYNFSFFTEKDRQFCFAVIVFYSWNRFSHFWGVSEPIGSARHQFRPYFFQNTSEKSFQTSPNTMPWVSKDRKNCEDFKGTNFSPGKPRHFSQFWCFVAKTWFRYLVKWEKKKGREKIKLYKYIARAFKDDIR